MSPNEVDAGIGQTIIQDDVPNEIETVCRDAAQDDTPMETTSVSRGIRRTPKHYGLKSLAFFCSLAAGFLIQSYSFALYAVIWRPESSRQMDQTTRHTQQQQPSSSSRLDPLRDPAQYQTSSFPFFFDKKEKKSSSFDVYGPPVALPKGETLQSLAQKTRRGGAAGGGVVRQGPEPPRHTNVPKKKDVAVGNPTHASEILQCGTSVTNFVVNATDRKDECDGLIKAFDKTCNNDVEQNAHRHERRKLWEKLSTPYATRFRLLAYRTTRMWGKIHKRFWSGRPLSFFAGQEVMKSWDDARYMVKHGIDSELQRDARITLLQCSASGRNLMDESSTANQEGTSANATKQALPNLQLPMKTSHKVSESAANDALLLQQGEKLIKAANESIAEEAAKSKKSISDTAEAVSAVLNDPSSIAARTCCASILNVYQDLCSKDVEEEVSDYRLFCFVLVMALCGMVKSLIRHFRVLWLPEAAGCILVGGELQTAVSLGEPFLTLACFRSPERLCYGLLPSPRH